MGGGDALPCLDDAQRERVSRMLVHELLERLERADEELRVDVLSIMERTIQDVARLVPVSRTAESAH